MKINLLLIAFLLPLCTLAQADTTVIYLDATGKTITPEGDFKSYLLIVKENDHYKKLHVDAFDDKIESITYYADNACTIEDGPYREFYKTGSRKATGMYVTAKKRGPGNHGTRTGNWPTQLFTKMDL